MKKTFAMMLALIMVFAAFMATVGTASAAEAEEGFMVATLNDITFDGELTIEKGKNHELVDGKTSPEVKTYGTPHLSEYNLDVTLENGTAVGAAYSIAKGELYFGVYAYEEVYEVAITIGGTEYIVNTADGYVEGGEGYAQVASSNSNYAYEIILPMNEFELKEVARGIAADLSIEVETSDVETFDGDLLFTKYASGFVYNALNKSTSLTLHAKATENGDGSITLVNDGTEARVYSIPFVPNLTKDLVVKFDLIVDSMPYSTTEDVELDSPGKWGSVGAPRLWFALKYRYAENLYMNIQNTADDGLVLNVYENYNDGFNVVKEQHTIVLGKDTGEKMTLEFEWSEATSDGKYPLNVYVDGKLVETVANAMNIDASLGNVPGVLQFNAQWAKNDSSSETIEATWGNISINEISALYSEDAYNGMADGKFGDYEPDPEGPKDDPTDDPADDPTDDPADDPADEGDKKDDNAPETEDKKDDTTSDTTEEKKGCGSSIAGFGLVAVLGTALTAVVASKKKED